MYSFILDIAGYFIQVTVNHEHSLKKCCGYLAENAVPDLCITMTSEDITSERSRIPEGSDRFSDGYVEFVALYRKICEELSKKGVVLIHGSCIMVDGKAFLFCAPSGTGKSTHVRLWREMFGQRVIMINDDKPLIRINSEGIPVIYGTPWNGKHNLGENISAPLHSICFLQRGKENSIRRLKKDEVLPRLIEFCYRAENAEGMIASLDAQDKILSEVGFFNLKCNMDPEAAKVAFEGMNA